ncbi:hypothetical protein [Leptolyngbya sp. FACHB-261]|nr:hypothetical protein [Leptolyngbya sp. FACHB-261]MBD2100814.1 hypothetical protein [Leptolyngbya sp. FACHB-261]
MRPSAVQTLQIQTDNLTLLQQQFKKPGLVAKWILVDGQLVCKWLLIED